MNDEKYQRLKEEFNAKLVVEDRLSLVDNLTLLGIQHKTFDEFACAFVSFLREIGEIGLEHFWPHKERLVRRINAEDAKCSACSMPNEAREMLYEFVTSASARILCNHCALYNLSSTRLPQDDRKARELLSKSIVEIASLHGDSCLFCSALLQEIPRVLS